jgi:branched-chain amino acid transport system substrate-binding protein
MMRIKGLGVALAAIIVAAACGGTTAPGAASAAPSTAATAAAANIPDTITIGAVLPLTGAFNASGGYFKQGYELATKEVNDAGGLDIAGKKVKINLTILDDGSDGTKSRSLVEQMVTQNKPTALLGGYDTSLVQAQQAVPDQYKVPMVEGGGAASAIFTRGNKYLFGTLATIDLLGDNTMNFLKNWIDAGKLPKPLKIALTWENTDHGKDYQAAVQKAAKADPARFQVVLDQSFELNASDFTGLLTQVKAANADAFLSDAHLPDYITMHKQYAQMGLSHKFVSYGARGPDQKGLDALGDTANYLVAGLWWTPAQTDKGSVDFTAKWKAAYNVTPDWFQALSYTTAQVLFAGISKAASVDGTKIRDALAGLDFKGAIIPGGEIKFDATGKPMTQYVMVQNLPGRKAAIVWPKEMPGYTDATLPIPGK